MMVRKTLLFVVCASVLVLSSRSASAGFSIGDLSAPGDGLLTIDLDTGLEWLDLTATQGLSWNQALASSFVASDGFTHATMSEVETLFLNAGFLRVNNVNNPVNDPAAAMLIDHMGVTQFENTNVDTGRGFAVLNSTTDLWLDVKGEATHGPVVRPNYYEGPLGGGAAVVSGLTSNLDLVDATAGHFLVRQSVAAATPEPSTFAIWGLLGATVGVGAWWKRR